MISRKIFSGIVRILYCAATVFQCSLSYAGDEGTKDAGTLLKPGSKLALVGDGITEQKMYTRLVESYLLMCSGIPDLHVFQMGFTNDSFPGFNERMDDLFEFFKPDVATLCYLLKQQPMQFDENRGKLHGAFAKKTLEMLKERKIRPLISSAGIADIGFFTDQLGKPDNKLAVENNKSLELFSNVNKKLSEEFSVVYVDIYSDAMKAMEKAKKARGDGFDVFGNTHPRSDGHLIIAYSFLKALGCDGNIGEITIDMKGGATGSPAHAVSSSSPGLADISSTRYPFCYDVDAENPNSNRSILPFLPFNKELNRFIFKVKNLDTSKAKIKWGAEEKEFAKEQLQYGINLMEEFQKTPFDGQFRKISEMILQKQTYETVVLRNGIKCIKGMMSEDELKNDGEIRKELASIKERLKEKHAELEAGLRSEMKPVEYKISVTPVK